MKMLNKISVALFLLTTISCNDLEEEVYSDFLSQNFYQNEEQLQTQALGVYHSFKGTQWESWMMELLYFPSKYATTRMTQDVWWKKCVYGIQETSHTNRYNVWAIAFKAISRANTIIKYAPTSPLYEKNPELIEQYVAEAKWLRAYSYFNLVQLFGDVPLYTEPVESPDRDVLYKKRSPVAEVYDLIIEDLTYASDKLPLSWELTPAGRVTKAAGIMLLGKVYLTMAGLPLQKTENYQKAIDVLLPLANNPSDYNVELLGDWASIFDKNNAGNKEILFGLGNNSEFGYGGILPFYTNPRFSGLGGNAGKPNYSMAWTYEFYQMFEDQDIRKQDGFTFSYTNFNNGQTITYKPTPLNPLGMAYVGRNGICGRKYIDEGAIGNQFHQKDIIIYRYADVFLMLAEAYMELNQPGEANNYLNVIRNRVNASEIDVTDQEELRQVVREERMRELYGEYTELFDMRRWGTAKENFLEHPIRDRRDPSRPWEDKYLLYPVPDIEIAANPNLLPQNPGW